MEAPIKNDVWHTLSQVDVSHLVQSKNGMDFVPWMDAWAELKKHYADATMEKHWPTSALEDGSYMVFVTITIPSREVSHTDMLPVKDSATRRSSIRTRWTSIPPFSVAWSRRLPVWDSAISSGRTWTKR